MDTWLKYFSQCDRLTKINIEDSLENVGVTAHAFEPGKSKGFGILFLDQPSQSVLEFIHQVSKHSIGRLLAIAFSHESLTNSDTIKLLQAGASDVLIWNTYKEPANEVAARFDRWKTVDKIVDSPLVSETLIGNSYIWKVKLREIVEVGYFTASSLLITGETGTGKELVARLIHELDQRPNKRDFVILDCTTIHPELSGSELFGHERGSFTGAIGEREGAFALANDGTLFLDEVGELSHELQAKLLRVIQEHSYKRIGSNRWQNTNFRLLCATNKDLKKEISIGNFRHDLYYRISTYECKLPSLRERKKDIIPLALHFLQNLSTRREQLMLDEIVKDHLLIREYPGNVRDLKQLCTKMFFRSVGSRITPGCISTDEFPEGKHGISDWKDEKFEASIQRALSQRLSLKEIGKAAEDMAIKIALENEDGNVKKAAKKLGVSDRTLQLRRSARLNQKSS